MPLNTHVGGPNEGNGCEFQAMMVVGCVSPQCVSLPLFSAICCSYMCVCVGEGVTTIGAACRILSAAARVGGCVRF